MKSSTSELGLIDKGFMHGDAQFNCSTSKKVVKLAGFPTMIS